MEVIRGGSSPPSYKDVVASKGKTPMMSGKGFADGKNRDNEKETDGNKTKENSTTKDKEEEEKNQESRDENKRDPTNQKQKSLLE